MTAMATELLVAPLAVEGRPAMPAETIDVSGTFSVSLPGPSVRLECEWPSGSLQVQVPDPVPVAAAGGALCLAFELPVASAGSPVEDLLRLPPLREDPSAGSATLLSIDVPREVGSSGERCLTGSLFLPRESIVFGHPLLAGDQILGPEYAGGCHIALKIDTVTGEAVSLPDQSMPVRVRGALPSLPRAAVEVRLMFEPAIGLLYVRIPNPALRAARADGSQTLADHAETAVPDEPAPAPGDDHSHPSPGPSAATGEGMVGQLFPDERSG